MTTYRNIGLNSLRNRSDTLMIDTYFYNKNKYLDQSLNKIKQLKNKILFYFVCLFYHTFVWCY